ncbi:MAG: hypothetical protein H6791_01675 [Candidatus Nomurabacteria bacterium]|nr:MAG: hypothetical protein H6791_01675 [Candidatus Nomurabacteria bacterium]
MKNKLENEGISEEEYPNSLQLYVSSEIVIERSSAKDKVDPTAEIDESGKVVNTTEKIVIKEKTPGIAKSADLVIEVSFDPNDDRTIPFIYDEKSDTFKLLENEINDNPSGELTYGGKNFRIISGKSSHLLYKRVDQEDVKVLKGNKIGK